MLCPVTAHGVHGFHEGTDRADLERRLAAVLAGQERLMIEFENLPRLKFNPDTDFDEEGRLLDAAPSHSAFIRH